MADAKMLNRAKVLARFKALPTRLTDAVAKQLAIEAQGMVDAIKRAAPVSDETAGTPGELRDSVRAYENPDRPLSYRIIADARDKKGKRIGPHVEFGHKAENGKQVLARPFFFPTYRARRKAMKRRLSAAIRKELKLMFPKVPNG